MKKQLVNIKDMEELSPLFRGEKGHKRAKQAMRIFAINRVNKVCENICDYNGADFAYRLLTDLGVFYKIGNVERLRQLPRGAFITISNHPYGGLDGVMLIDLMASIRPDYKLMVNSVLSLVRTMSANFITVKPLTKRKGANNNIKGIRETLTQLQQGHPVGFFPSGAVSDFKITEMRLRDREWQLSVIKLIYDAKVPVVPIRFFDHNSLFFYFLGLISWRIRSLRMPYEIFNKTKQKPRIGIGNIILPEEQEQFKDVKSFGEFLRKSVYDMPLPASFKPRADFDVKDILP